MGNVSALNPLPNRDGVTTEKINNRNGTPTIEKNKNFNTLILKFI